MTSEGQVAGPVHIRINKSLREAGRPSLGERPFFLKVDPIKITDDAHGKVNERATKEGENSEQPKTGEMLAKAREALQTDKKIGEEIKRLENAKKRPDVIATWANYLKHKGSPMTSAEQKAYNMLRAVKDRTLEEIEEAQEPAAVIEQQIANAKEARVQTRGNWVRFPYAKYEGEQIARLDAARKQEFMADQRALNIIVGDINLDADDNLLKHQLVTMPNLTPDQRRKLRVVAQQLRVAKSEIAASVRECARLQAGRKFRGRERTTFRGEVAKELQQGNELTVDALDSAAVRQQGAREVDVFMARWTALGEAKSRAKFLQDLGITQAAKQGEQTEPQYSVEANKPYDKLVVAEARYAQLSNLLAEAVIAAHKDPTKADRVVALSLLRTQAANKRESAQQDVVNLYRIANKRAINQAKRALAEKSGNVKALERGRILDNAWRKIAVVAVSAPRLPGLIIESTGAVIVTIGYGLDAVGKVPARLLERQLQAGQAKRQETQTSKLADAMSAEADAREILQRLSQPTQGVQ